VSGLLIVNADDVGHDRAATDATLECVEAGRITSVSAMVHMEDSRRASEILGPADVGIGLHLNVSEGFTDPQPPRAFVSGRRGSWVGSRVTARASGAAGSTTR
jgi:predicted glycoside hydrolase/deacetylase ChbG (UPF0249 family)